MSLLTIAVGVIAADVKPQEMVFGYCGEPQQTVGTPWTEYTALVEFSEDFVKKFNGAEIVAVQIASPDNFDNPEINDFTDIDLAFYRQKGGESFYSQKAELSDKGFDWKQINLDSHIKIEEGNPFFVGYSGIAPNLDAGCFAVDFQFNSDNIGLWLGWEDTYSGEMTWESFTQDYGNLCLRLVISGDNLPSDEITLEWIYTPMYTFTDMPFMVSATVTNNASNDISSIGFHYTVGEESKDVVVDVVPPLKYEETRDIDINGVICSSVGNRVPFDMSIISVNGNDNATVTDIFEEQAYVYSIPEGIGYERNVVAEEGTGTWCGYCPIGIVGMEYMKETYNDGSFIPIAIHGNDVMESPTYIEIAREYFTGYPSAIVNRDTYRFGVFSPEKYLLETAYKMVREIPAFAKISMEACFSDDTHSAIDINTISSFAIMSDDTYSVAFAITQDNVGPYVQTNFFANNAEGEMGGWESKPDVVPTIYNDVARGYFVAGKIDNSPGEPHNMAYTLPLDFLEDRNEFTLVAMIINDVTGDIENAVMTKSDEFTGVKQIADAEISFKAQNGTLVFNGSDSQTLIYSTDGKLLHSQYGGGAVALPSGMYIVKSGNITRKIII